MIPRRLTLFLLLLLLVALAAGYLLLRLWQGPSLPGYQLEARPLVQQVIATGRVITPSRTQVGSQITGVVRERRVEEGDRVVPGQVLLVLRADDLAARLREAEAALTRLVDATRPQAEVTLRQAETQYSQAERESQRRRDLFARGLIAREALEQAEQIEVNTRATVESARLAAAAFARGGPEEQVLRERVATARAELAKTELRSEVNGIVLTRNVEPGDLVQPGRVLLEIATNGDTELLVPVDEKNLSLLAPGQYARCIADAWPDRPFDGELYFIAPVIDPRRGTVDIRFRVNPVPEFLRQDMTVSVNVETGRRAQALVAPNDALFAIEGDRAAVYTVRHGRAERRDVHLGLRGLALSEITDGLAAGDWVLIASALVSDGGRVRISQRALPTPAGGDAWRRETPVKFD